MLILLALGILVLGAILHYPADRVARLSWVFPSLCAILSLLALYLAYLWHHSLAIAKRQGDLAERRASRQRAIAHTRLAEREQWHRSLFQDNPLVMLLIDPQSHRIVDASDAAARFYGLSRQQLLSLRITDISMMPEETVRAGIAEALRRPSRFTFKHRCADGIRDVNVVSGPIVMRGRRLLFSTIQDATAQVQAEEAVRRIIDASPMGFHLYNLSDGNLVFTRYNRAAEEILQISHAQLVGKPIEDIFRSPEMTPIIACFRAIAQDGGTWTLENVKYSDGAVSGSFDIHAFQAAPASVAVMFSDATERYRQEELLSRRERRFRMLYERSPLGIATIDLHDLRILSANDEFQKILGFDEQHLQNLRFDDLPVPDAMDAVEINSDSFTLDCVKTLQRRYLRHDGGFVWVELSLCAIPAEDEAGIVGLAILQDITQRKRTEEQLQQAKLSAERANAAKDQFLATLSHELRTPLSPVLLITQSVLMERGLSEKLQSDLAIIQRNIELEARLIDDLLDLTRISRGKLQLHTAPVNMHETIHYALEICRPDAQDKDIRLEVSLEAQRSTVIADSSRLQQVFWNLIKNAIKFTPRHGHLRICTRNDRLDRQAGENIIFEVTDSGVGMDEHTLKRIFLPFEQGSIQITKVFGGLGMGLAISKAIVDLHGGRIEARSSGPNQGSTFTVRLVTATEQPVPQQAPDLPSISTRSLRVLLVEDHEATALALGRVLHRCGCQVINANSVGGALRIARDKEFDLLISDLGLPDGSGLELVAKIHQQKAVPAIALSGYGMDQDIRDALDAGFQEHLTKPVTMERLLQAIARVTTESVTTPHA